MSSEEKNSPAQPLNLTVNVKAEQPGQKQGLSADSILDLLKWVLGTLILGTASLIINTKYQNTQQAINAHNDSISLEIKRIEADSKFVATVNAHFDKTDLELSSTLLYYRYISPFITSDKIGKQVAARIADIEQGNTTKDELQKAALQPVAALTRIDTSLKASLSKTTRAVPRPANELLKKEDAALSVIANASQRKSLAVLSASLYAQSNTDAKKIFDINQGQEMLSSPGFARLSSEQKWFKESYYLEFNGSLRILLEELGSETITIKTADISNNPNAAYGPPITLRLNGTETLSFGDYTYRIVLDLIGRAGRNPFTKAAYISVTTYQKRPVKG